MAEEEHFDCSEMSVDVSIYSGLYMYRLKKDCIGDWDR